MTDFLDSLDWDDQYDVKTSKMDPRTTGDWDRWGGGQEAKKSDDAKKFVSKFKEKYKDKFREATGTTSAGLDY